MAVRLRADSFNRYLREARRMVIKSFPPVESADEHGLIAVGGDLEPESVILAYQSGIFPWPLDEETLAWFAPPERAVIFLDEFHISRRLQRTLKRAPFTTKRDTAFPSVILRCAELKNRGDQDGTWITNEIVNAYTILHTMGFTHSFESYLGDELVGGLYGIQIGRFFAAESSFFRQPDASKVAMCAMVEYLRGQNISWFDCQVLTPFSEGFGAREISRSDYMRLLASAL
jgi:leucyl/phenylalanyl-tRNA--protein transferase